MDSISAKAARLQNDDLSTVGSRQWDADPVEEALERLLLKSPRRRDSYSDSTDNEEVEKAFSQPQEQRPPSIYHMANKQPVPGLHPYEASCHVHSTIHSAYYSPNQSPSLPEMNRRYEY